MHRPLAALDLEAPHEMTFKVPGIETWFSASDPLVFRASTPQQMLSLLLARIHDALGSEPANATRALEMMGVVRNLCGWLIERGDALPTPQGWAFEDSPGLLLNKAAMTWSLYVWAMSERTLTSDLRSALVEMMKANVPDPPQSADDLSELALGMDLSSLQPAFIAAASESLDHLVRLVEGLVALYER